MQNEGASVEALLRRLGADGGAVLAVEEAHPAGSSQGGRLLPHLNWPCTLRSAFRVGPLLPCTQGEGRSRRDTRGFPLLLSSNLLPPSFLELQTRQAL